MSHSAGDHSSWRDKLLRHRQRGFDSDAGGAAAFGATPGDGDRAAWRIRNTTSLAGMPGLYTFAAGAADDSGQTSLLVGLRLGFGFGRTGKSRLAAARSQR